MRLHDFDVLSFDCYGTLIDWETGLIEALKPLSGERESDAVLADFAAEESAQQRETPDMPYARLLAAVHARLMRRWGLPEDPEADRRFGNSVPSWPAFDDTAEALAYLKRHYRLVILSNVDHVSFRGSLPRLGVAIDAVYTAEDVGSYKPDPRNFRYLLDRLREQGIEPSRVLHVAQSLYHDHKPANDIGLASAWIDRRHGKPGLGATAAPPAGVRHDFRFTSLQGLAEAHVLED